MLWKMKKVGFICLVFCSLAACQSIDYADGYNQRYPNSNTNANANANYQNQNLNRQNVPYQNQNQNQYNSQNGVTQYPLSNVIQPVVGAVNRTVNTLQNAYGAVQGYLNNNTFGNPGLGGPGPSEMRSYIRLQLQGYLDQGFRLSQSSLCQCPAGTAGDDCVHNSPSRKGYGCYFNFMVVVSSTSPEVLYDSTPFVLVDSGNGNVNPNEMPNFRKNFEFNTQYKITGLTIIVNHNGAEIDATTGRVNQTSAIINVDRFTLNFENNTQQFGQSTTSTLSGQLLGTSLQLSYTVGCSSNVYGSGCNLACNRSSINAQYAVCRDIDTGYYSTCQWTQNNNNVYNCEHCPWGVRDNSYCVDQEGNALESHQAGVVSSDYKTATIILGVITGILLLCLLAAVIASIIARRRATAVSSNAQAPGYNNRNIRGGHVGNAESQPLHSSNERPTPPSRYTPNIKKPIIRPAVPAAYLGGDNPNDTLNTSYASQSPMNVSRSADV